MVKTLELGTNYVKQKRAKEGEKSSNSGFDLLSGELGKCMLVCVCSVVTVVLEYFNHKLVVSTNRV